MLELKVRTRYFLNLERTNVWLLSFVVWDGSQLSHASPHLLDDLTYLSHLSGALA